MAKREFLPGDARQRERAYSPAVKVGGGTTIYLAGYGAFQDEAGKSYAGDFDGQVRLASNAYGKRWKKPAASSTTSLP